MEKKEFLGELWIDKLARITGMESLSNKVFKKKSIGAYLYVGVLFLVYFINWRIIIHGFPPIPAYFYSFIIFVGLMYLVWSTKRIRKKYRELLDHLDIETGEIIKYRDRAILYIIGLFIAVGYLSLNLSKVTSAGILPFIFILITTFILNLPVIAEFIVQIYSIHFKLPSIIREECIKIDFTDPFKKSGLEDICSLYLFTTQIYFIGISLYLIIPIYSLITGLSVLKPGNMTLYIHSGAWILGLTLFFIPQFWIRRYVRKEKERKISDIYEEMRQIGKDSKRFPEALPDNSDEMVQYMHSYQKLEMIHSQGEYPFDMAKVKQLFTIAVIPLGLELFKYIL